MARSSLMRRIFGGAWTGERRRRPRAGVPGGMHVLVVDDSATIRAVLGKMLSQNGHLVLKAGDGETALELVRDSAPDLIFLDIVMPGMNGFTVLRALRRDPRTRSTPVVMISGNPQATEQFYVKRVGADEFMKKPFGRSEVFSCIMRLTASGRLMVATRTPPEGLMLGLVPGTDGPDAAPVLATPRTSEPLNPPDRDG